MKVGKAVIVAAGRGTRFLPATKAVPKEMLPLLDRPLIHYAVAEAVASGIGQIVIITAEGKEAIRDYFEPDPGLERFLEGKGDRERLEMVRRITDMADISYVIQQEQLGLGHAVLTARRAVGDEPLAVILPDDIVFGETPVLKQMMEAGETHGGSVVAVETVGAERISSYGVIDGEPAGDRVYRVKSLVEKPEIKAAPSNLGVVGRYILEPEIFGILEKIAPGSGGEIQLTDGLNTLCRERPFYALEFTGRRHDTGKPAGLLGAALSLARAHPDYAGDMAAILDDTRA